MKRAFWSILFLCCLIVTTGNAAPLHIDLWRGCTRYKNGNLLLNFGNEVSTLALIGPENFYGGLILAASPWQEEPTCGTFRREKDGSGTITYPNGITLKVLPAENESLNFVLHIPAGNREKIYLKLAMKRFLHGPTLINGKAIEPADENKSVGGIREMVFNSASSERGFRITVSENTGATAFYNSKAFCADIFPMKGEEAEFTIYFVPEKTEETAQADVK